jgi:hypothetical protein
MIITTLLLPLGYIPFMIQCLIRILFLWSWLYGRYGMLIGRLYMRMNFSRLCLRTYLWNVSSLNLMIQNLRVAANSKQGIRVAWARPRLHYLWSHVKIKVDGAVSMITCTRSYSAICRSDEEFFMGSSTMVCPRITDPIVLETLACREALALASDLYCRRVFIACRRHRERKWWKEWKYREGNWCNGKGVWLPRALSISKLEHQIWRRMASQNML